MDILSEMDPNILDIEQKIRTMAEKYKHSFKLVQLNSVLLQTVICFLKNDLSYSSLITVRYSSLV